uniref:hypothetical protein n=1 Tax=uncultured Acidovorax sp. TaxID=158751 RepID=UPI0025DBF596|nr:hypothetical protein [uncultured Acidovorax sp.]
MRECVIDEEAAKTHAEVGATIIGADGRTQTADELVRKALTGNRIVHAVANIGARRLASQDDVPCQDEASEPVYYNDQRQAVARDVFGALRGDYPD